MKMDGLYPAVLTLCGLSLPSCFFTNLNSIRPPLMPNVILKPKFFLDLCAYLMHIYAYENNTQHR